MEDTWYFMNQTGVRGYIYISTLNAAMNATPSQKQTISRGKTFTFNRGNGSKNYGQITTTGHLRDVYRRMRVIPRSRGITTHPYQPVYQVVVIRGSDGKLRRCICKCKHEAYTELQLVDAIVS